MDMKKVLFLMMLIVTTGTLKAQWSITPEVGMTSALQIGYGTDNWRSGWKVGAGIEYELKPGLFALKSGLYYMNRKSEHFDYYMDSESEEWAWIESKMNRHLLQIPLMGKLSFRVDDDVYFTVAAGPYFALHLSRNQSWYPGYGGYGYGYGYDLAIDHPKYLGYGQGSYHYDYSGYANNTDLPSEHVRPFDWGLTGSIGLEIKKWVINLGYDFALGEEFKEGYDSIGAHYHTLSLSAGYKFSIGK